ncbi:MAG TPA: lipopolysaccharide heptosyltransferase II [Acidobacteriota bacterium]|nr:lipopolysaccharide heptosyltransferase II [Acidobacteriota bacterium]
MRKILVRGTNWVGDAVMSIPALREIRRIFPGAHISLLAKPWVKDVYSSVDFVDELIEYDRQSNRSGWWNLVRLAADLKRNHFDMAILLQNAFEAAFLAWRARIPVRLGYARDGRSILLTHPCRIDPRLKKVHQSYYYLGILAGAGLIENCLWERPDYPLDIRIGVRTEDRASAKAILRARGIEAGQLVVGLNPGASYGGAKRWLSDRYARVADELARRHDAHIVIFGAAGESQIAQQVAEAMTTAPVILAGQTTLGQLMGLIKECSLMITNDSGPMHLAAALDVPQLAIFGSTSEVATGPLSNQAEVIKHPVECNPCFLRECPIDFRCMTLITVERVVDAAERKLRAAAG